MFEVLRHTQLLTQPVLIRRLLSVVTGAPHSLQRGRLVTDEGLRIASHRSAARRGTEVAEVAKTSVQWLDPAVAREGTSMQFTTFDAPYLERLRRGDAHTERHFAAYFGELIKLKLRRRLNAREAIEDVRQETFVRVLSLIREKDGVRQPERLGALVNSVCNLVLLEHYRAHSRVESSIDAQPQPEITDQKVSVSGHFEVDQTERAVREILGHLPERERRLLQSVLLDERDKDEVCAELGLTRDHLRVLVHRAKQSFKSSYMKRLGDMSGAARHDL
jgi:RNA polymerase sigma-70 factor, ECF subfamily